LALTVLFLAGCSSGGSGGSSGGGTTYWYADWYCTGSQCAAVMGGYSGTAGPFSSSAECEQWRQTYILTSSCSTNPGGGGGAPPTISDFTPKSGAPGISVTITGSNFPTNISDITVTVSGVTASVTSATSTQLVIMIPAMGNLTGPISVTTPSGNVISAASFTVIVPNPIANLAIKKIAPGYSHTCAILADDSVKCWGSNESGQLGDGTTTTPSGAVAVGGVANPIDIAVGISFSCGVFGAAPGDPSGSVQCWGKGTSGQLGNNANANSATPVPVTSLSTVIQISARANHVCALLSSGQIMCWGDGSSGQLGNGSTSNASIPVAVQGTGPDDYSIVNAQGQPASTKAFQVSAGDAHTCARVSTSNGSAGLGVKCWGATNHGELGNGAALCEVNTICDPKAPNPVPQYVSQMTSAVLMAAGAHHTCTVITNGQLRCWGQGDKGQLGNNSNTHSSTAVVVFNIPSATMTSAGSEFSCASAGGALKCWGGNNNGQLGNGGTSDSSIPVTATAVAAGTFDPTTLMGGDQKTCMKLADNTSFCFP